MKHAIGSTRTINFIGKPPDVPQYYFPRSIKLGDRVTIIEHGDLDNYLCDCPDGNLWWFYDCHFKPTTQIRRH